MESFTGEIRIFAGDFAPEGWHICDGSILLIKAYQPLYTLLENTYGGQAPETFALPDLRGRLLTGMGSGKGLTPRPLASSGGTETVTLTLDTLTTHSHAVAASESPATTTTPGPDVGLAAVTGGDVLYVSAATPVTADSPVPLNAVGGSQAHENRMPSLGINYIICLNGIYPHQE